MINPRLTREPSPAEGAKPYRTLVLYGRATRLMHPTIALVVHSLEMPGGQGIQAGTLVNELQNDGYEVIFLPINPRFPLGLRWLRRCPYARTLLNQALYLPSLLRLRRADVAHIFSASYWSFLISPLPAILVARSLGKRIILNYHSGEADDHLDRWGLFIHPWLKLVDEIVVPSEYLQNVFARYGYQARVIQNVVDTSRFRYRERVPLQPRLLSTRNLEPHYRVDNTIEAFAILKTQYPEATLTIAGSGSEESTLRRLATSLGTSGIRFTGHVERLDVPALYESADILVNSSVIDNQPISVLEAFATGLLVVSTGTGGIATMVRDGETGLTVPAGDPPAMAKAIIRLLDDSQRALAMSRRARREVQRHTWSEVSRQWAAVYEGRAA